MDGILNQRQAKWWCIYFGQERMDEKTLKKLQQFSHRITQHVVLGANKVFLDVTQSRWRHSIDSFQDKLESFAKRMKINPEIFLWGEGGSIAEAWVQARWQTLSPDQLPLEAIADFLNPIERAGETVGKRNQNAEEVRKLRLLRSLGVSTLQDLIEIPEDILLTQCGLWIGEFAREYFSVPERLRDHWLEETTAASLLAGNLTFHLDDWIPEEYMEVG